MHVCVSKCVCLFTYLSIYFVYGRYAEGIKLIRAERSLKAANAKKSRTEVLHINDDESKVEEYDVNVDSNLDMIMEELF